MTRSQAGRIAGFWIVAGLASVIALPAAEDGPDQQLGKLGLKRAGAYYLLESESYVLKKFDAVRGPFGDYLSSLDKKDAIQIGQARLKYLEQVITTLDHDITALDIEYAQRPGRPNSVQRDHYAGIRNQLDSLKHDRNEAITESRMIRSVPSNPTVMKALDEEIKAHGKASGAMLKDVKALVKTTNAEYATLAKDDSVGSALAELSRGTTAKLKLGPSPQYQKMLKEMDQMEKALQSPSPGGHAKPKTVTNKKGSPKRKG